MIIKVFLIDSELQKTSMIFLDYVSCYLRSIVTQNREIAAKMGMAAQKRLAHRGFSS